MSDIDKIKQLRAETFVSYAMCKSALDEAEGDIVKAREILKRKGAEVALKKADRDTSEGNVFSYVHHNKKIAAIVTLLCETDFVAKSDGFQELGNGLAMHIASTNPEDKDALMNAAFIKDPSNTIDQLIKGLILQLGENISIGEFTRFEV